ncbi:heavy-metal-associated domain-containing protein [Herbiconiux sp. SALV-R1]|nr:heavy-metal-associated domain-containing protein [Herbiconiux sp. SALV-R1]
MQSDGFRDLGLTARGGDGCACCAPGAGAAGAHGAGHAGPAGVGSTGAGAGGAVTTLLVEGMTCAHCVASVTEELSEVDGVESVTVELVVGGASTVRVAGPGAGASEALQAAVEEAGYTLAPRS